MFKAMVGDDASCSLNLTPGDLSDNLNYSPRSRGLSDFGHGSVG